MSAWWPVLQQRLVTVVTGLVDSSWVVIDGPAAGLESGKKKWITVGASTDGQGGTYDRPDGTTETLRRETGTVVVEVNSWTGDTTANATRRSECFAVSDALEALILADQTLGVLPAGSTSLAGDITTPSNGKSARLLLSVSYTAFS